jgi:hypothetical protein
MSLPQLTVPFFLLMLMVVFSSCVLFWIEKHCSSDDLGPAFESIPHSMYFTIVTISTVGYGDLVPHSDLGKAFDMGLILIGVLYMAMPLAIVGTNFTNIYADRDWYLVGEKARRKFLGGGMTSELLRQLFEETETDNSGAISKKTFISLLTEIDLGFTVPQIKSLFRGLDMGQNDSVSFTEFHVFLFPDVDCDDEYEVRASCSSQDAVTTPISRGSVASAASVPPSIRGNLESNIGLSLLEKRLTRIESGLRGLREALFDAPPDDAMAKRSGKERRNQSAISNLSISSGMRSPTTAAPRPSTLGLPSTVGFHGLLPEDADA